MVVGGKHVCTARHLSLLSQYDVVLFFVYDKTEMKFMHRYNRREHYGQ
jgi:hypothetical protein